MAPVNNKISTVCLIGILSLVLVSCAKTKDPQKDNLNTSSLTSVETMNSENGGIDLPDQEFTSNEQSVELENTNTQGNSQTSSVENNNNKNEESPSSQEHTSTPDESDKDNTLSGDDQENISSEETDTPSKKEDGSVELPFDKW